MVKRDSKRTYRKVDVNDPREAAICATLHYFHKPPKSQQEIAKQLGIHPSTVSRLLKRAHEDIINIRLNLPRDQELQAELTRKYNHLRGAVVVPIYREIKPPKGLVRQLLGQAAARYLEGPSSPMTDGMTIGLSCGGTLLQTILNLSPNRFSGLSIFPLTVESLPEEAQQAPSTLVGLMRAIYPRDSKAYGPQLPDRNMFNGISVKLAREVSSVISHIRTTISERIQREEYDLIIFGIGEVDPSNSDLFFTHLCDTAGIDAKEIRKRRIIGEINNRPYDALGHDYFDEFPQLINYTYALEFSRLREYARTIPVISIAGGPRKAPAIRAALKEKLFNILITDSETAELLIQSD